MLILSRITIIPPCKHSKNYDEREGGFNSSLNEGGKADEISVILVVIKPEKYSLNFIYSAQCF